MNYEKTYLNKITTPQKGSAEYAQVEKSAAQEYADRLKQIDQRMRQVQALRNADMGNIRRNQETAQRDINDQMFREYLASRERMGGRGVANSGLMADAQIRLNANKQDRMAELYNQTQEKLADVNRTYAPQQTELLSERGSVRQSKIFREMFDELLNRRSREAQMLSPLMQNQFTAVENQKSRSASQADSAANRRLQLDKFNYEKEQNELGMSNQRETMRLEQNRADIENIDAQIQALRQGILESGRNEDDPAVVQANENIAILEKRRNNLVRQNSSAIFRFGR